MEFLRGRTNAVDASIREFRQVEREYLTADEDTLSDEQFKDLNQRLRAAAMELSESAELLAARIDGDY
jgi:hypothetical protein